MTESEMAHAEAVLELGAYTLSQYPQPPYVLQELVGTVAQLLGEVRRLQNRIAHLDYRIATLEDPDEYSPSQGPLYLGPIGCPRYGPPVDARVPCRLCGAVSSTACAADPRNRTPRDGAPSPPQKVPEFKSHPHWPYCYPGCDEDDKKYGAASPEKGVR